MFIAIANDDQLVLIKDKSEMGAVTETSVSPGPIVDIQDLYGTVLYLNPKNNALSLVCTRGPAAGNRQAVLKATGTTMLPDTGWSYSLNSFPKITLSAQGKEIPAKILHLMPENHTALLVLNTSSLPLGYDVGDLGIFTIDPGDRIEHSRALKWHSSVIEKGSLNRDVKPLRYVYLYFFQKLGWCLNSTETFPGLNLINNGFTLPGTYDFSGESGPLVLAIDTLTKKLVYRHSTGNNIGTPVALTNIEISAILTNLPVVENTNVFITSTSTVIEENILQAITTTAALFI